MPPIVRARATTSVRATPAQLWPYIADTNRVDHAVGLPPVTFSYRRRAEGGETATGEYRLLGRGWARWTEHPFEWEQPYRYAILREYARGPFIWYRGQVSLTPAGEATTVTVTTAVQPRDWLAWLLLRGYLAGETARRARARYEEIGRFVARQAATPFPTLARPLAEPARQRLEGLIRRLRDDGAATPALAALRDLIATGDDQEVAGMRPLEWAERWRTEPRATLDLFLRATVAGLLELRWELLCPGCRGVKATAAHLRALAASGFCPACNRHAIADQDDAIEARFYPAPTIRAAEVGAYCVGSPALTPHRLAQANLGRDERRAWQMTLRPGDYLVSAPQCGQPARLRVADGAPAATVGLRLDAAAIAPAAADLAPGPVTIALYNASPVTVTVALDDEGWARQGATPGRLMTLPAFHQLFSSEALASGAELAVGRVGLLFTDLAGSTALYERAGEALAFRLVSEHFGLLQTAIEAAGGALVKTIGDSVMAAFPDGQAAVAAGLAMQRAIRALDTRGHADPRRLLKVGVHVGPCYLVTLNDRLDYFGTAVNLAARAQHEARGGEVVVTAAAWEEGAALVADRGLAATTVTVAVRGLAQPATLYRIDSAAAPDPVAPAGTAWETDPAAPRP